MNTENRIQNIEHTSFGFEGKMDCPAFQRTMDVMIDKEDDIEYAQKCADYLCNMPESTLLRLCTYSIRYCEEFRSILMPEDMPVPEHISGKQILEYFRPNVLIVERPEDPSVIGFHVECGCDWEPEHGLEFTIKDDKILYVGSFDDMPAWSEGRLSYAGFYDPNNDMNMNYADKE